MTIRTPLRIQDYNFPENDFLFYFRGLYRDRGFKAFYQFLNRPHRRPTTRKLLVRFAPVGIGLEVGVGARTVAPVRRTILSDGFHAHGQDNSVAKVFFRADEIPYAEGTFSFVLSEHMLEHSTNPIKVLKEWIRVLSPGGVIFVVLPHRDRGSDRFRERTTLSHLIEDYEKNISDADESHLPDWNENVVKKGILPNHYLHLSEAEWIKSGSLHHHVWVAADIIELFGWLGLEVVHSEDVLHDRRDSFLVVGRKQ